MPKIKTHRGAAKRFSLTKTGKVKHKRQNKNHILTKKSTKRKRQLRQAGFVGPEANTMKKLLPYS